MCNICTRFVQDCSYFSNAQYMLKIFSRLYLFLQVTIYAQDLRKIVLISSMHNIWARFEQDCTYFSNEQYMHNICPRLYLFLQCTIYMRKICAKFFCRSCAYFAHWTSNYNLVKMLCIYCTLQKEVQSCANLVHILHIGEISTIFSKS